MFKLNLYFWYLFYGYAIIECGYTDIKISEYILKYFQKKKMLFSDFFLFFKSSVLIFWIYYWISALNADFFEIFIPIRTVQMINPIRIRTFLIFCTYPYLAWPNGSRNFPIIAPPAFDSERSLRPRGIILYQNRSIAQRFKYGIPRDINWPFTDQSLRRYILFAYIFFFNNNDRG